MNTLSFDNIPPLAVPFRFFSTAPLFGIAAGILLVFADDLWGSRWQPVLLGFTHLLTLGVMAMVMFGALFQMMPVVSSQPIPGTRRIAPWVHLLLSGGTLALVAGFVTAMNPIALTVALLLLISGFLTFLGALALGLLRAGRGGDTVHSMRLAGASLLVVLILGVSRVVSYAYPQSWITTAELADYHAGWGLGGWVVLLIMGVSFQVIPMFHVAPNFRKTISYGLTSALFASQMVLSVAPAGSLLLKVALLTTISLIVSYALYTLNLIRQRKRRVSDPTIHFWQLGLTCLTAAGVVLGFQAVVQLSGELSVRLQILAGVLFIYGFAISIIKGMLQKIIPFLIYMHLQRGCMNNPQALTSLPNMKHLVSTEASRFQFQLHAATLTLLAASLLLGIPGWPPGIAMVIDFGWLLYVLIRAQRIYHQTRRLLLTWRLNGSS